MIVTSGLAVCVDCAEIIANGDLGMGDTAEDAAHAARMVAVWGDGRDGAVALVLAGDEFEEAWFSSRSCDGCGSTLGGDRLAAAHIGD